MNQTETPFEKKNCADCAHLKALVNLWCSNPAAIKARGTAIPGVNHCPYWSPDWNEIPAHFAHPDRPQPNSFVSRVWQAWEKFYKPTKP